MIINSRLSLWGIITKLGFKSLDIINFIRSHNHTNINLFYISEFHKIIVIVIIVLTEDFELELQIL